MEDEFEEQFERGLELFNSEEFYACHDTIEEIWLQEVSSEQAFLQGIIQTAVAFHHYQHGKLGAARSMLQLAIEKLEAYPARHRGVSVPSLVSELREWKAHFIQQIAKPSSQPGRLRYPKIVRY